jgi:selenocysteine lyase/cysteine desulfurase
MVVYANHAGTSWPKPAVVAPVVAAALQASPQSAGERFAAAHAAIAAGLGLPAPDRLLLTTSCTAALAVAIGDLPWQPDDVVVTSGFEHHALVRPVQQLAPRGVRHVVVPPGGGQPIDLALVEATLRAGRVRLLAVCGASNVTGEVMPIAALARLAKAHGAQLLLDAAQTAGVTSGAVGCVDADGAGDAAAARPDLVVFAGHKGLLGPLGLGGLWAAPEVAFACPAASCEVGAGGVAAGRRLRPYPGFCDVGSVNLPAAQGLAAALAWAAAQPPAERRQPRALAARLRAACRQRPFCRVLGGAGPHTGATAVVIAGLPLANAEAHFEAHGIVVRAGQHCAPLALQTLGAPDGVLRISFGHGNVDADVDAVLAAIDATQVAAGR